MVMPRNDMEYMSLKNIGKKGKKKEMASGEVQNKRKTAEHRYNRHEQKEKYQQKNVLFDRRNKF